MSEVLEQLVQPREVDESTNGIAPEVAVQGLRLVTTELANQQLLPKPQAEISPKPKNGYNRRGAPNLDDNLSLYLHDIGRYPLLNAEQERTLAQTIEKGKEAQAQLAQSGKTYEQAGVKIRHEIDDGVSAKEAFINANLRLVVSRAKKYHLPPGISLLDVIQEGNFGLEHAVDKFDWRKGFKFSTYATWWIRQSIGRFLDSRTGVVYLPSHKGGPLRKALGKAQGDLDSLSDENLELYRLNTPLSLNDTFYGEDADDQLQDTLADTSQDTENTAIRNANNEKVAKLLENLDPLTASIIKSRFGFSDGSPKSWEAVGAEFGMTSFQVKRRAKRVFEELKENPEVQTMYQYSY